jgi:hypothetical protein
MTRGMPAASVGIGHRSAFCGAATAGSQVAYESRLARETARGRIES